MDIYPYPLKQININNPEIIFQWAQHKREGRNVKVEEVIFFLSSRAITEKFPKNKESEQR